MRVRDGVLIAHRLIDAADTIDLARAEALWRTGRGGATRRTEFASARPNELAFEAPPLLLELPPARIDIDGVAVEATMAARLYDFGALALMLRIEVHDLAWDRFVARSTALEAAVASDAGLALWQAATRAVLDVVRPALDRPAERHLEEDYLSVVVHRIEPAMTAAQFREQVDLAPLLSGESRPLAPARRAEMLLHAESYFEDDLVVLSYDRAFMLEPREELDIVDVVEVANAQLLEMRYYDALLDTELARMYDTVANARGGLNLLASRRAARIARRLHGLVAEVTQLTGKVESTLRVNEDVYLARVYGIALDTFRVPKLTAAVDRKLALVRDTYVALYEEASSRRAELLELAIVLLIVFEIVLALVDR